jgi:hypothetical protein
VTENACRPFLNAPAGRDRPKIGQLAIAKTRANTGHGIVAGHAVATDQPEQLARAKAERITPWLAGDECATANCDDMKQGSQCVGLKVVQEQIRENHVAGGDFLQSLERVPWQHGETAMHRTELIPDGFRNDGTSIQQHAINVLPSEAPENTHCERSIASAEIQHGFGRQPA